MKRLPLLFLILSACATTNPYAHDESSSCPAQMTEGQYRSGAVRCLALCSSWGRDLAEYKTDCRCVCKADKFSHTPTSQM